MPGPHPLLAGCFLVLLAVMSFYVAVNAQDRSYWLSHGRPIADFCRSNPQQKALEAGNAENQWILITGTVTCKDTGSSYSLQLELGVAINPSARHRINRDMLNFDWLGLAIFRPQERLQAIAWLYDVAHPIRGSLPKTSLNKIYFDNLQFMVSKMTINQATEFTYYMTSEGILYTFGLL
jgi:hypothetical protein